MERYIEQLIEDIHISRSQVRPPSDVWNDADVNDPGETEDMAYAEEFIYGTAEPLEQITRIGQEQLPREDQLTPEQKSRLAKELLLLLLHYNFVPDFPKTFPLDKQYAFIRGIWKNKYVELSFGQSHIEFCSYEEEDCPFPGYCTTCEEIKAQMEHDEEVERKAREEGRSMDDEELPF